MQLFKRKTRWDKHQVVIIKLLFHQNMIEFVTGGLGCSAVQDLVIHFLRNQLKNLQRKHQICDRDSGNTINICADSGLEMSLVIIITHWKNSIFDETWFLSLRIEIEHFCRVKITIDRINCAWTVHRKTKNGFHQKSSFSSV